MDERTIKIYVEDNTCVMSERTKGVVYDSTEFPSNIPDKPSGSNTYFTFVTISFLLNVNLKILIVFLNFL